METKKFESFEHFLNTVRFLRKKREQSTYLSKSLIEVFREAYDNPDMCSEYIQYIRLERKNTEIDKNHFMNFFYDYIGYTPDELDEMASKL